MYCGIVAMAMCVCLCVQWCIPTLLHAPGCNFGIGKGCPVVVHYWAVLQLVYEFHCYGNIIPTYVYVKY